MMAWPVFETLGVAPMLPAGPCFATPVFRTENSNSSWYQKLSSDQTIERFDEVDDSVVALLKDTDEIHVRRVGEPALFAYVSEDEKTHIGEKAKLREVLYEEYWHHRERIHLRHSIAKFLTDGDLIQTSANEVAAWRRSRTTTVTSGHPNGDTPPRASRTESAPVQPTYVPKTLNRRPGNVADLLIGGELHSTWYHANARSNRFFLVNMQHVLARLGITYTNTQRYLEQAEAIIATETEWPRQLPFEYRSSHVQLSPEKLTKPKRFGHAATIIVAVEIMAKERDPRFNVYDLLRILPAQYFVDRFDLAQLNSLKEYYESLSDSEKAGIFGHAAVSHSFERVCLDTMEQPHRNGLLEQLAAGFCVTKYTADKLVEFVENHFPPQLHVGPARSSGEDSIARGLGNKNAAPSLRVPRTLPIERLREDLEGFRRATP